MQIVIKTHNLFGQTHYLNSNQFLLAAPLLGPEDGLVRPNVVYHFRLVGIFTTNSEKTILSVEGKVQTIGLLDRKGDDGKSLDFTWGEKILSIHSGIRESEPLGPFLVLLIFSRLSELRLFRVVVPELPLVQMERILFWNLLLILSSLNSLCSTQCINYSGVVIIGAVNNVSVNWNVNDTNFNLNSSAVVSFPKLESNYSLCQRYYYYTLKPTHLFLSVWLKNNDLELYFLVNTNRSFGLIPPLSPEWNIFLQLTWINGSRAEISEVLSSSCNSTDPNLSNDYILGSGGTDRYLHLWIFILVILSALLITLIVYLIYRCRVYHKWRCCLCWHKCCGPQGYEILK